MFCRNCGKELDDDACFCSSCGARINNEEVTKVDDKIKTNKFGEFENKMYWYKFIAYIGAYLYGIPSFFAGIAFLVELSSLMRDSRTGLGLIIFSIGLIIFGILVVISGILLLHMKKNGYKLFILSIIVLTAVLLSFISIVWDYGVLLNVYFAVVGIVLGHGVPMIIANAVYFSKRERFFN